MTNKVRITFKAKPRETFNGDTAVYYPERLQSHHVELIDDNIRTRLWVDCRDDHVMKSRREDLGIASYDYLTSAQVEDLGGKTSGFLWNVSVVVDVKTGEITQA